VLKSNRYDHSWPQAAALALALLALSLVFQKTFVYLYANWQREEYSHGFVIPFICAFLVWQRRRLFLQQSLRGSWSGVAIVLMGLTLCFLGIEASIVGMDAWAMLVVILGCVVAAIGWRGVRIALVPLGLLVLMVPLPTFWYNNLSSELQLISSQLGVKIIRLFGGAVFLEGNVIDLGFYKLQVAEACSGLRYLFPLMTLGVIVGYLFKGRTWARWTLFLSTIPIAVLMNSVRIGIIGLLVARFGIEQARGFLHQFEGWLMFMICFGLLLLEGKLLLRLSGDQRRLGQVLGFEAPKWPERRAARPLSLGMPAMVSALLLLLAVFPAFALPERTQIRPRHIELSHFPLQIGGWAGRRERLESLYLDELKLDDYLLADYVPQSALASTVSADSPVNLYVAYYASQRTGQSIHSPRSCLPGGGWRMREISQYQVPGVALQGGAALRVNRAVVQKGTEQQLVYYWFQERGRDLTNEYSMKWYLIADGLLLNRSDGALIRVITPFGETDSIDSADARLRRFTATILPELQKYVGS
jgi:exosortase D (VPLPA-CTERM-specific)